MWSLHSVPVIYSIIFGLVALIRPSISLNNGLALTPPMGWMTWERYRCNTDCLSFPDECISETLIRNTADLLVSEGYLKRGYEYVIIDDCWLATERDAHGNLQPDAKRFPSGIKNLSDYVHSKGLKFGIYEDLGTKTCAGYPGLSGHLKQDADQFAEWGVDYIKVDGCYIDVKSMDTGYPEFGRYLNETKRPIVYSCSWPAYQDKPDYKAIAEHCNLWRNNGDIQDSYDSLKAIIDHFAMDQDVYAPNAGPGHWNDPDMLIIGNFGLSYDQSQVQMAIWAVLAAPLLMSTDLKAMRPEYKKILQNEAIIKINQDPLGIQGKWLFTRDQISVWSRPILPVCENYYSYAIAFVSYRDDGTPFQTIYSSESLGLNYTKGYTVTDLYAPDNEITNIEISEELIFVSINPSGVIFGRFDLIK